jgi:hypothetical protein
VSLILAMLASRTGPNLVGWAAWLLACVLAFVLVRQRRSHLPFAVWASAALVADIARAILEVAWSWLSEGPHVGLHRVAFHLDQALFVLEPIGLIVASWAVFLRRRSWIPAVAGLAVLGALCVGYPWPLRGDALAWTYAAIQTAAVIVPIVAIGIWTRRRAHPRPEHAAVSLAVLIEVALLAGPYSPPCPAPFENWQSADLVFLTLWIAAALLHVMTLWRGGFGLPPGSRETLSELQ